MAGLVKSMRLYCPRLYRKCTGRNIVLWTIIATVLVNEFFCYTWHTFFWKNLYLNSRSEDQIRLLFVSDPQLIGLHDVYMKKGYEKFQSVAIWDSDRYLYKGYSRAYNHAAPDAVVFLGDLLDEGSTAKDEEYEKYTRRFYDTFYTGNDVQKIIIPGDNDVGGEGFDVKEERKVNRFRQFFPLSSAPEKRQDLATAKFVDFIPLDHKTYQQVDTFEMRRLSEVRNRSSSDMRVLLSHQSLLQGHMKYIHTMIKEIEPNLILSGHTHKGRIYSCQDCREDNPDMSHKYHWRGASNELIQNRIYEMNIKSKETLVELNIPTCSYRMGVPKMGYGFAVLDEEGNMKFTILSLPSRYFQLYMYIIIPIILAIYIIKLTNDYFMNKLLEARGELRNDVVVDEKYGEFFEKAGDSFV